MHNNFHGNGAHIGFLLLELSNFRSPVSMGFGRDLPSKTYLKTNKKFYKKV